MTNFKHFSPLQKLNSGLYKTKAFEGEAKINTFGGRRYHRFSACNESFRYNLLTLNSTLRRIGEHYQLTYKAADRLSIAKITRIHNIFHLSIDLETFILKIKALLDCVAFYIPFYYKEPLLYNKQDARDLRDPWAFRSMRKHFIDGKTKDRIFREILVDNQDWIDDVLWKRDILFHKFHSLSITRDHWTDSYYAYLCEFNQIRDFIPNIIVYVSGVYYKLIKFLESIEIHFKEKCEKEFSGYEYYHRGDSFGSRIDKVHYYFASLGRLLDGKILIRINPAFRHEIGSHLNKALVDLSIKCPKCNKTKTVHKVRSTIEHYVIITAHCNCGNALNLSNSVAKRFYPHFFDRNQNYYELIPEYKLKKQVTF